MLCEMWNNLINVPNNVEKVNAKNDILRIQLQTAYISIICNIYVLVMLHVCQYW